MTRYDLPESLTVAGRDYSVRWDFRAAMDIFAALNDPDLGDQERALVCLGIFYPDWKEIPPEDYGEALRQCFWFLNGGQDETQQDKKPLPLMRCGLDRAGAVIAEDRVLGAAPGWVLCRRRIGMRVWLRWRCIVFQFIPTHTKMPRFCCCPAVS